MGDLKNPKVIYLKAGLFLVIGGLSGAALMLESPHWKTLILLILTVWAFARLYYFMFYAIEYYVDPSYRFAGISSFVFYVLRKLKN